MGGDDFEEREYFIDDDTDTVLSERNSVYHMIKEKTYQALSARLRPHDKSKNDFKDIHNNQIL